MVVSAGLLVAAHRMPAEVFQARQMHHPCLDRVANHHAVRCCPGSYSGVCLSCCGAALRPTLPNFRPAWRRLPLVLTVSGPDSGLEWRTGTPESM